MESKDELADKIDQTTAQLVKMFVEESRNSPIREAIPDAQLLKCFSDAMEKVTTIKGVTCIKIMYIKKPKGDIDAKGETLTASIQTPPLDTYPDDKGICLEHAAMMFAGKDFEQLIQANPGHVLCPITIGLNASFEKSDEEHFASVTLDGRAVSAVRRGGKVVDGLKSRFEKMCLYAICGAALVCVGRGGDHG